MKRNTQTIKAFANIQGKNTATKKKKQQHKTTTNMSSFNVSMVLAWNNIDYKVYW